MTVTGSASIRFGSGTRWVIATRTGVVECTIASFGSDPSVGAAKECDTLSTSVSSVSPPRAIAPPVVSLMPVVDKTKIPSAQPGFTGPRIQAANVADSSQVPVAADVGAFREPCAFSHMNFDDPIVYPGQPGASHLHAYFGNTDTGAASTAATLAATGSSTCAGGILNRTAYWVPAMIDTRTGTPVQPAGSIFYYKTGYNGISPQSIRPLPRGLRMIAGDPRNATPSGPFRYGCVGGPDMGWYGNAIPKCSVGSDMLMEVTFPQCWDGVNLDSPDHKSHMADPVGGVCPATHPVPLPVISFEIHYTIKASDSPANWRLASDNYDNKLPGGYSGHADWFSAWDAAVMQTITSNCENKSLDCHAYLIGDGRTLY